MTLLSPGVEVIEIGADAIVPTVSNSIGVFCGNFDQGPVGTYILITNVEELITFYGKPSNTNYNEWYQAYNFLQYGNKLLVSRAANTTGTATVSDATADVAIVGVTTIPVDVTTGIEVGQKVVFGNIDGAITTSVYEVTAVVTDVSFDIDSPLETAITADDQAVYTFDQSINSMFEAVQSAGTPFTDIEYQTVEEVIENATDFEDKEISLAFVGVESKLKIISRNPGNWGNDLEIAIATPALFTGAETAYAFDGIALNEQFEYLPTGTEVGILVRYNDEIVETFTVDFDMTAKDYNNKSTYVEKVINNNSKYIFVKDNTANVNNIEDYIYSTVDYSPTIPVITLGTQGVISLIRGVDTAMTNNDLLLAYELFDNKEHLDIDIVIGNEEDAGVSAKALVETREDCIAFIGAELADTVGKKASIATANIIEWRTTGNLNYNNMFVVACGNYKYQYDRYNDANRWVNIAGDIAGLRAQTSTNRASWWASAGLERGQIKNVIKLAFNPNNGHRDLIYKNGINPIVSFPGQGTVMWGQKTLLDKPSSFDRVNVRGLFNTLERALSKMAKYQVMEFNDNFTRNRIISMIKPYLGSVKAGRGIEDFLVICDESNNTADIISRNQLIVDIYVKPTYVAEFIQLRFTNAGTNSFAEVIV